MLIPIGHENMKARRLPIITFALILINVLAFLATYSPMEKEGLVLKRLQLQIAMLAVTHPELTVPPDVQPLVTYFRQRYQEELKKNGNENKELADEWNKGMRADDGDFFSLEAAMESLVQEYRRVSKSSIIQQYALIPAHPHWIAYLTANFLHANWLHLIGNLWFLWLVGFVLEDVWGRGIYLAVYLVSGIAALQFYSWTNAGSVIPTIGASGAVAALMGAFLVRFPKMKIEMLWTIIIAKRRFHASAYWLLSLWLLTEVLYGALLGTQSGVAHWAHVGGFVFGATIAVILRYSGIEHTVNAAIEKQINTTGDPEMRRAQECIDRGDIGEALTILQRYATTKPTSLDAWSLLRELYSQNQDNAAYLAATLKLCELHVKAHQADAAWRDYEDFLNAGGTGCQPAMRFELCRLLENQSHYEHAIQEYERLAADAPSDRYSLLALMAAGKACLKKLNRPADALRFYEAADKSIVPHLDLVPAIEMGIHDAQTDLSFIKANPGTRGRVEQRH
jgi:membrane associated rhomboid family serine protease